MNRVDDLKHQAQGAGPVVVVTTMPLSPDARSDLSEMLGDEYAVIDIKKAPPSANVVLTTVVSERALRSLRALFPVARILLAEFHDWGRGIRYAGPITRALEAGPDGYFVAHGLESLPAIVQFQAHLQLSGNTRPTQPLIDVGDQRVAPDPVPVWPPASNDDGTVIWVETWGGAHPAPDGHRLELRYIDDAVSGVLETSEPRDCPLWASLVAESAAHLVREGRATVLVDVSDLPPDTRVELRVHLQSERISHTSWPPA